MAQSRYSQLGKNKPIKTDRWSGVWHGQDVSFERLFRGHYFSDDECRALCRGETLDLTLDRGDGSTYAFRGCLFGRDFVDSFGKKQVLVTFKGSSEVYDVASHMPHDDIVSQYGPVRLLDSFSDDDDARIAAMLMVSDVKVTSIEEGNASIDTLSGRVPIYRPSVSFLYGDTEVDSVDKDIKNSETKNSDSDKETVVSDVKADKIVVNLVDNSVVSESDDEMGFVTALPSDDKPSDSIVYNGVTYDPDVLQDMSDDEYRQEEDQYADDDIFDGFDYESENEGMLDNGNVKHENKVLDEDERVREEMRAVFGNPDDYNPDDYDDEDMYDYDDNENDYDAYYEHYDEEGDAFLNGSDDGSNE